ncbi:MAG: hypothetical protein ACOYM7_05545 [Paludibacter sp.]
MIHTSILRKILKDDKPFNCRCWKNSTGEILTYNNVVCTSSNFERNTANLLFVESREVRKVRIISIFEINDEEIYI